MQEKVTSAFSEGARRVEASLKSPLCHVVFRQAFDLGLTRVTASASVSLFLSMDVSWPRAALLVSGWVSVAQSKFTCTSPCSSEMSEATE